MPGGLFCNATSITISDIKHDWSTSASSIRLLDRLLRSGIFLRLGLVVVVASGNLDPNKRKEQEDSLKGSPNHEAANQSVGDRVRQWHFK